MGSKNFVGGAAEGSCSERGAGGGCNPKRINDVFSIAPREKRIDAWYSFLDGVSSITFSSLLNINLGDR